MYKNIAFIPVRGGSKSIPSKNIKKLNGKPLVYWTVKAAHDAQLIDHIYVSTDSFKIKAVVESFGFHDVTVVDRSHQNASDTASTESAMLEFANQSFEFENIVLIQATSPLLKSTDLDAGIGLFEETTADSLISVVRKKQFIWKDADGIAEATYDYKNRPRRQEYNGYLVENGAFYITRKNLLLETECRISGVIRYYEMNENSIFEIDEPADWKIMESIMKF